MTTYRDFKSDEKKNQLSSSIIVGFRKCIMKLVSKNAAKLAMLFGIIKPIGTFLQSRLSSHIAGATGCLDLNRIISFVFSDEVSVVSKVIQIYV